jgi:uncharacterized repeat protein (TIGR01451 family)
MMSRSTLLIGLITGLFILAATTTFTEAQVPHTVMGQVLNSDDSVPAIGELSFEAHLIDVSNGNADSEVRTQYDPGNAYGNGIMGAGWFEVECGNFSAFDWADGDSLVISFTNSANGQVGRLACALSEEMEPQLVADFYLHEPLPEWSLDLDDDPDSVWAGQELIYTIRYRNGGQGQATGVTILDTIPSATSYQSCTGGGSHSGRVVTWSLGTISPDDSGSVTLTVTVDSPLPNGTLLHDRVHVNCNQSVDGTASEVTTVRSEPQWSLDLSDSPDPVNAGDPLTFTILYHNTGTDAATGVTIVDTIPAYASYWSHTGGGTYDGHRVIWTIGTVAAGISGSVTLTVLVDWPLSNGTVIDNRTHVTCDQEVTAEDEETTTVSPDLDPPAAVTDLMSSMEGFDLSLNWSSIATDIYGEAEAVQGYIIYRDEMPMFTPTSAESIAMVSDSFFVDGGSRAGDAGANSFYLIRGVDFAGNLGVNSNRAGEIDFQLPTNGPGYMMMSNSLDDGATTLASQLGARVPNCTAVKEWDASTRAYISDAFKVNDTWYGLETVTSGYPYYLFIGSSGDSIWTLTGQVPADPSFQLVAPTGNDYNTITLPLSSGISLARDLGASIPHCTAVKEWDERTQGYVSLAFKVGESWFGTGFVQRGHPYYVNVTAGSTWPTAKTGTRDTRAEIRKTKI